MRKRQGVCLASGQGHPTTVMDITLCLRTRSLFAFEFNLLIRKIFQTGTNTDFETKRIRRLTRSVLFVTQEIKINI